jgi:hypothetical protein
MDFHPTPSDHLPVVASLSLDDRKNLADLVVRSECLGWSDLSCCNALIRKPIKYSVIDHSRLTATLESTLPTWDPDDLDSAAETISDALYAASQQCMLSTQPRNAQNFSEETEKWKSFMERNDAKTLWHAIGWNGKLNCQPTDSLLMKPFKRTLRTYLIRTETSTRGSK